MAGTPAVILRALGCKPHFKDGSTTARESLNLWEHHGATILLTSFTWEKSNLYHDDIIYIWTFNYVWLIPDDKHIAKIDCFVPRSGSPPGLKRRIWTLEPHRPEFPFHCSAVRPEAGDLPLWIQVSSFLEQRWQQITPSSHAQVVYLDTWDNIYRILIVWHIVGVKKAATTVIAYIVLHWLCALWCSKSFTCTNSFNPH